VSASNEVAIHALERQRTALLTLGEWDDSGAIPTEVIDEAIAATEALPRGVNPAGPELLPMLRGLKES
jgi:hypothetical protein